MGAGPQPKGQYLANKAMREERDWAMSTDGDTPIVNTLLTNSPPATLKPDTSCNSSDNNTLVKNAV